MLLPLMSFALAHQGKMSKAASDIKKSTVAKPYPRHRSCDNLLEDSYDSSMHLQRTIGNQAVQRLLFSNSAGLNFSNTYVQSKLSVSLPSDAYEQ